MGHRITHFAVFYILLLLLAGCAVAAPAPGNAADGASVANSTAGTPGPQEQEVNLETRLLPQEQPPGSLLNSSWRTDFSRRTIDWKEVISGGPPKDGIPAIDKPTFESVEAAGEWLSARDPVILFRHNDVARAYPLAILIWHEIVNDEIDGLPVTITFCPLCNASIAFDRNFDGQVLDFGVSGLLRNSDMIMYDRQSESWWQQFTGEGIAGEYAGERLDFLISQVISFADFEASFPGGEVLARPALSRSYGANPYVSYDTNDRPFLFRGEPDPRLPSVERVAGAIVEEIHRAYAFSAVRAEGVINDVIGTTPVALFFKSGVASALDTREIREGRDVGGVALFERQVEGRILTFTPLENGLFSDNETGSTWNVLGEAIEGELEGTSLAQLVAFDHFWFAWSAFFPDTELYGEE
jgi:hypothetical protein